MSVAMLSAQRSKDPNKQARSLGGAVLAMWHLCSFLSATCMLKHIRRSACCRIWLLLPGWSYNSLSGSDHPWHRLQWLPQGLQG